MAASPSSSSLDLLALQQKALGDPNRLRIVRLLREASLCVCELEALLGLPQYAVSRHLGILRRAGWVEGWREGTWMHYRIAAGRPPEWEAALDALCRLWDREKTVRRDLARLRQPKRKGC